MTLRPFALSGALLVTLVAGGVDRASGEGTVAGGAPPGPLALTNAVLIDPARGVHQAGMTVLIEGERIGAVFPDGTEALPEGAHVIDLEGRYLIPGLIESHTHLSNVFRQISISPGPLDPPSRETMYTVLERMLYGGVVAARDMAGDARIFGKATHNILTGERKGPDVFFAALMGGRHFMTNATPVFRSSLGYPPGEAPWLQTVEADDDPALNVARAAGTGASAIKFYIGVEADLTAALAKEAHRQGLKVWGHAVVFPARPIDVVRAGVDVISHACGLAFQDASVNPANYPEVTPENRPRIDPDQIDPDSPEMAALFEEMVRRGTVFDATLYHHSRPGGSGSGCTPELAIALVSAAHRAGVIISAGTDTYAPEDDDYPVLHLELERLVDSGVMTPTEALVAGTFNGALALGREDDYGTVEPGKLASLVVLEGDPTVDIRALRTVEAVIKRGRIHPRAEYTTGLHRGNRQPSDTAGTDPYPQVRAAQTAMTEAMAAADCDRVAGFFADGFTFYARGRHLDSRETVVGRCRQVPRPFPEAHHVVDEVRVLSGTMALALLVMEMHRDEPDLLPRREVITRLWTQGEDERWRISHMHVSLDEVPDP